MQIAKKKNHVNKTVSSL